MNLSRYESYLNDFIHLVCFSEKSVHGDAATFALYGFYYRLKINMYFRNGEFDGTSGGTLDVNPVTGFQLA